MKGILKPRTEDWGTRSLKLNQILVQFAWICSNKKAKDWWDVDIGSIALVYSSGCEGIMIVRSVEQDYYEFIIQTKRTSGFSPLSCSSSNTIASCCKISFSSFSNTLRSSVFLISYWLLSSLNRSLKSIASSSSKWKLLSFRLDATSSKLELPANIS